MCRIREQTCVTTAASLEITVMPQGSVARNQKIILTIFESLLKNNKPNIFRSKWKKRS